MSTVYEPACPCGQTGGGKALTLVACCAPMLQGTATAQSAEALMRSRYTAYVLGDMGYVSATWHPSTRPSDLEPDAVSTWLGLDVKSHSESGDTAQVSFVARYRVAGKGHRLQEHSQFVREAGVWFYLDALK